MELDNELVAEELGHIRKIFGRYTAISSSGPESAARGIMAISES